MSNKKKYIRIYDGTNSNAWMDFPENLSKYEGKENLFVSTSYYNEKHYEHFKKTKSVAGIDDTVTDKIWFDFDNKENPQLALNDTRELLKRLKTNNVPDSNIKVFFSGSKGLHVIVDTDKELNYTEVKKIALDKFAADLKTVDVKVYDANRVLRIANTKHKETGLYKIPLSHDEVNELSINEIKEIAKGNSTIDSTEIKQLPDDFYFVKEKKISEKIQNIVIDKNDILKFRELDLSNKPLGWKDYKWALAQGRFKIGERHNAMMVIASTCRALRYGEDTTRAICEAADKLHCEITGDAAMQDMDRDIKSVFSDKWKGGQYSFDNDPWLQKYCLENDLEQQKEESSEVIDIAEIEKGFKHFVLNIDKNTIKTGIEELDKMMPITVGQNVGILGSASSGKTAISLSILKNTSEAGIVSVMASLDMHRNRIFEKLLYKVSAQVFKVPLEREDLYKLFQENKEKPLIDEVKKQYGNVYFYDRSRPNVDDIKNFILKVENQTGKKVKLLMVDYFERVGSDVTDATASSLLVANQLQDLLNDLNLAVITLVQPNKFSLGGGPDNPILSYTAIKGSSFIYQAFRSIISIWRPFFTPKTKDLDKFLEMAILKNDLGELDHFKFNWVGKTGEITSMGEEDRIMYNNFLEEKKKILLGDKGPDDEWFQGKG